MNKTSKIKIAAQVSPNPSEEDIAFIKEMGLDYVTLFAGKEEANYDFFMKQREIFETNDLKIYGFGNSNIHNHDSIVLNLNDREKVIEDYKLLSNEFETDKSKKDASHEISEEKKKEKESLRILYEKKEQERLEQQQKRQEIIKAKASIEKPVTIGKIDLNPSNPKHLPTIKGAKHETKKIVQQERKSNPFPNLKKNKEEKPESEVQPKVMKKEVVGASDESNSTAIKTKYKTLTGPKKTGQTIDLDEFKKKEKGVEEARKRKRKRISKELSLIHI